MPDLQPLILVLLIAFGPSVLLVLAGWIEDDEHRDARRRNGK